MEYLLPLRNAFEQHADAAIGASAAKYMRNLSEFYGIPSPLRRQLLIAFLSENKLPEFDRLPAIVEYCWQQPQREWQYAGMEMVSRFAKKQKQGIPELGEFMIVNKSWWDTVDYIATNVVGESFRKKPETIKPFTDKWMHSGNLWLQRTCLIFQLKFYQNTDTELLFRFCRELSAHQDFFIRKAIGWALRQYSKSQPGQVLQFVTETGLSNLSRTEALKIINKKGR